MVKVGFVASPLTARSGVYRSARELVSAGRDESLDWQLLLGVSGGAPGGRPADDPEWIVEEHAEPSGLGGVRAQSRRVRDFVEERDLDVVVSLIPQTDMALAIGKTPWIAFTRGLPWPAPGEAKLGKRVAWRTLERAALRRAREVWATTGVLRDDLDLRSPVEIVPAGIAPLERSWDGAGARTNAVWAARFDEDKRPHLFATALQDSGMRGRMFGTGHLQREIAASAPSNVTIEGWAPPSALWEDAFVYVGTSSREAYGRSAVEAAMNGVPVVLASSFGCADQLVSTDEFKRLFVLESADPAAWREAVQRLRDDEDLRRRYSDHLVSNARALTIAASAKAVARRLQELQDRGVLKARR